MNKEKDLNLSAIAQGFDEYFYTEAQSSIVYQDGNKMTVLKDGKSYKVIVKSFDVGTKKATINVSGFDFHVTLREPLDRLMDKMGFLAAAKNIVKEVKSPMPGLIGTIYVTVGQSVLAGDKLLSLEAMKMENIIKSAGDGIVKKVNISNGMAVEKNTVLIEFE